LALDQSQSSNVDWIPSGGSLEPAPSLYLWAPAPKFQHRYWIHLLLFSLTLLTTTIAGALGNTDVETFNRAVALDPFAILAFLGAGLSQSVPVLLILGAHEFGHYFACRYHNVDATLPYFLPAPLPLIGTFGAVIRIREAFPSKRALFDIGVAGPIAGFVALIPFLVWGLMHSTVVVAGSNGGGISLGEPLLYKLVEHLVFGPLPAHTDVMLHPTAFAAWFGMLATALNLMPFGQLDGGHIAYAVAGRRAVVLSALTLAVTVSLTFWSRSWLLTAVMLIGMAIVIGIRHPRIHDEDTPLDTPRKLVAVFAFIMFVLCFMPVPLERVFG
jgi:membrane-associated protease RseP (regulator of RpoE activity)